MARIEASVCRVHDLSHSPRPFAFPPTDLRKEVDEGNLRVLRFATALRRILGQVPHILKQHAPIRQPMMLRAKTSITTMTTVTRSHR
jgi:hypothetical protein